MRRRLMTVIICTGIFSAATSAVELFTIKGWIAEWDTDNNYLIIKTGYASDAWVQMDGVYKFEAKVILYMKPVTGAMGYYTDLNTYSVVKAESETVDLEFNRYDKVYHTFRIKMPTSGPCAASVRIFADGKIAGEKDLGTHEF